MSETDKIYLTEFSKGGGCGCKISSDVLHKILSNVNPGINSKALLVGNATNDDAAVYDLQNGTALISTTDFFTPVIDNPFDFGRVAATNALSDVYAMGGKPILALAILGYPPGKINTEIIAEILNGATSVCSVAGISIGGGHTIESSDIFFGLSVNGLVKKENLKQNNTAKVGDFLFLTKPLGVGILSAAIKRKKLNPDHYPLLIDCMTRLNSIGEVLGRENCVNAMTDISGFGFLGHLLEVCKGSNLTAEINFSQIQFVTNLDDYIKEFIYPDITTKTYSAVANDISDLNPEQLFTLCDPQTSGGLLVCVAKEEVEKIASLMLANGVQRNVCTPIGRLTERKEKYIYVI